MKTNTATFLLSLFLLVSCQNAIKNPEAEVVVEAGTDTAEVPTNSTEISQTVTEAEEPAASTSTDKAALLGFWVGYFNPDEDKTGSKVMYMDEGYMWNRANKINISIDAIEGDQVTGHSVVAGNDRPFEGTISLEEGGAYVFLVKEPGDDRYDGTFEFRIKDNKLKGTWKAYKKIDIQYRKYSLSRKDYAYDPAIKLEYAKHYVDWNKAIETKELYEDGDYVEEFIYKQFASATSVIYEMNASEKLLSKAEVENLKQGDLLVIRNTIYARHGYSFKHRPLRVFFDAQPWYIPVHTDIRADFTEIEKENIKLLMRYEKNAAEYYDSFGRG